MDSSGPSPQREFPPSLHILTLSIAIPSSSGRIFLPAVVGLGTRHRIMNHSASPRANGSARRGYGFRITCSLEPLRMWKILSKPVTKYGSSLTDLVRASAQRAPRGYDEEIPSDDQRMSARDRRSGPTGFGLAASRGFSPVF